MNHPLFVLEVGKQNSTMITLRRLIQIVLESMLLETFRLVALVSIMDMTIQKLF